MSIESPHWTDRLSEYIDGDLAADEQGQCAAHLDVCAECRGVAAELRSVIAAVKGEADVYPDRELWPAVVAAIAPRTQRRYQFTLGQLALAASLLIAVTAGVAYVAAGRSIGRTFPVEPTVRAEAEAQTVLAAGVARANFADAQYDQAVLDLEQVLVDMRDQLDPRTVLIIERNLATIDEAIAQARAALDADPANTFLNSHLADARRKKIELLRRATSIASASGD